MLLLLAAAWAADPAPTLDLTAFTGAVIEANPEADLARAALERAQASAEAAGPWPDPMVDVSIAPLSLATMPGWQIQAEQDLPLWGTRRAAQDMAAADADVAAARLAMMRLDLADMAAMAWADWYAVHRELELVAATATVLTDVRDATLARVALGRATSLDTLQAQAELGWLTSQQRSLFAERDVVAYRINTLLHQDPEAPVPPPPATLSRPPAPAEGATRPEVAETAAMRAAAEAEARMAQADRLPMVGVMAAWTTMLPMPEHRLMAGLSVAVPLDQGSRAASQRAADAGVAAAHAEQRRVADQIALRIATAEIGRAHV